MLKKCATLLLVLGMVSACATVPSGPSVMVLPGAGKPFDQFQLDDMVCRQFAQQQIGVAPGQAATQSAVNTAVLGTAAGAQAGAVSSGALQERYDIVYVQYMYAKGDQVPGVAAAPSPSAPPPPPPGPPRH
jgi:hypothetical protein